MILKSLDSVWFVEAVWFFYWARFATYFQIGLMFSALTVIWLLAEIPTGFLADKYGRKLAITLGLICHILGAFLIFSAQSWANLFWGGFFENVGRAFISGSLEALLYDDLKNNHQEQSYDRIISLATQFSIATYAVSVLFGGFLYAVHFRLPHFLMFLNFIVAFAFSLLLKEPIHTFKKLAVDLKVKNILIGFRQLLAAKLRAYLPVATAILILFFLYDWGFAKPAMAVNFGYYAQGQGIVYAIMAVISVSIVGLLPKIRLKFGDKRGLKLLLTLISFGFILSVFRFGFWGIAILLLIETAGNLAEPWISVVINKNIDSEYRATTLSTLNFFSRTPFLFLNMLAGRLLDLKLINYFHLVIGLIFLTPILVNGIFSRKLIESKLS